VERILEVVRDERLRELAEPELEARSHDMWICRCELIVLLVELVLQF
jgi:hypothetical protein